MRASATSNVVLVGLVTALGSNYGCSSEPEGPLAPTAGTGAGTSGSPGASSGGTSGSGSGGSTSGGTVGMSGASAGGVSGGGGVSTGGGGAGGGAGKDITEVWKSDGFGKAYAGPSGTDQTLATMGVKEADCAAHLKDSDTKVCGPWMLDRVFRLNLPEGYDPMKSYPLLFEGPGCGGGAGGLYQFDESFLNKVIRVGLQPSKIEAHGTHPGQGCFDDKEGDDSMDWVFYEVLYDKLNAELSFDRNRVFSAGNSSGAWFSNELGCKYAGDAKRPVRGVLVNTGGLPTDAAHVPTCTQAGMAGMWVHETMDPDNPFAGNVVAIDRAMKVNQCAQQSYATAEFEDFPIGGGQGDSVCKRIKNCDALYPLVVCLKVGTNHAPHPEIVLPGFPKFMGMFSLPPLLTP